MPDSAAPSTPHAVDVELVHEDAVEPLHLHPVERFTSRMPIDFSGSQWSSSTRTRWRRPQPDV